MYKPKKTESKTKTKKQRKTNQKVKVKQYTQTKKEIYNPSGVCFSVIESWD